MTENEQDLSKARRWLRGVGAAALYNLMGQELLPKHFAVVGFSRSAMSDEEFRAARGSRAMLPGL